MANDRSLKLEVILAAIDKATKPLKAISGGSARLAQQLRATKQQLKELDAAQRGITSFRDTARAVAVASNELKGKEARLKELRRAMADTLTPSKALVAEFDRVKREAHEVATRHTKLVEKQHRLRESMRAAGVDTRQLGQHQRELQGRIAEVTATLSKQEAQYKAVGLQLKHLAAARANYDKTLAARDKLAGAGAALTVAGGAIGAPIINAVREYSSFEDAMLGVQRQVQGIGEVGSTSYKQISTEIRLLGRELPIPINQLADMYTAAARMEVPREGLRDFTRTITMMATAFDAVPDEIAESMGKVAKNFRIPVTEVGRLADVINYLDDQSISKSADIIDVLNRTSGVAASVALTDKATAALASTLLSLGDRAEPASTAINSIIQKFAAAEKGSKDFRGAMDEIGLSLSAVQSGMQQDAQGTLFKVIEAIQRLPANQRTGVMVDLVGMEHADTMAKLVTNTAEWRRQIELANSEAANGSMEREFAKRTVTLSAGWERLKNSLFDLNVEVGGSLRGSLTGVMDSIGGVLNRTADWMRDNQEVTAILVKVAAAVALVVTAMGALALALAAVLGPFAVIRYGLALFGIQAGGVVSVLWGLAKAALPAVAAGLQWVLGLIIANPIGAAIAGIAVAALLIYKYWEPIKAFFIALWDGIKANFNTAVEWFAALPARFAEFGTQMMQGLVNGITSRMESAKAAVMGVGDSVVGWFKEKLGIHSPSRVFAELGGFTMEGLAQGLLRTEGGPLAAIAQTARAMVAAAGVGLAGTATAGDGPGFTFDNRPPLAAAPAAGASGGNSYTIQIYAAPGMDEQAIARAVTAELDRRDRAAAARTRSRLSDLD